MQKDDHSLNRIIGRYLDRADCDLNKYSGWLLCPDDLNLVLLMYIRYLDGNTPSSTASNLNVRCDPDESGSDHKPAAPILESSPSAQVQQTRHPSADPPTVQVCLQDLPAFILPIPYHFVIYDTGKKLESVYGAPRPSMIRLAEVFHVSMTLATTLGIIWDIYYTGGKGALHNTSGPLDGPYGLCDDRCSPSADELELASSGTGNGGHSPPSPSSALIPTDSAPESCRDGAEGKGEGGGDIHACENWEAQAHADEEARECVKGAEDEDEEWEDPEYGEYLKAWAEDVWKASWEAPSRAVCTACAHMEH
ncbi:hypothetical protein K523DRAFT_410749 [Schizophyllum commune Tattone D]|nr:hypothetical protein K523DRAFT_410749 [Schizophyllum commune Tattone D]